MGCPAQIVHHIGWASFLAKPHFEFGYPNYRGVNLTINPPPPGCQQLSQVTKRTFCIVNKTCHKIPWASSSKFVRNLSIYFIPCNSIASTTWRKENDDAFVLRTVTYISFLDFFYCIFAHVFLFIIIIFLFHTNVLFRNCPELSV